MEREKFDHTEERLRAIEGGRDYAFADMEELCLVPNVIIPPMFKVLDFDKYKGTTCPKNHLKMYCRKMGAYTKEKHYRVGYQGKQIKQKLNKELKNKEIFPSNWDL